MELNEMLDDFVRNVGGMSDDYLSKAKDISLRATLYEFRNDARKILNEVEKDEAKV